MTTDSSPQAPRILSRRTEIIFLVIYCICYSVTSLSHVLDVVNNGLTMSTTGPVPGTTVPLVWGVLSKAFTILNPLTLILLLVRRQAGIALMVGVTLSTFLMQIELMVQWWIQAQFVHVMWLPLIGTLGTFQLVSAPWMWRTAAARAAQSASGSSPAIAG
ncbi:hypothetical protein [Archangium lansingense]|uniref:Uncharacterized protein n=1 Tax=Archangium lansingense TaxID=2995310 RepID=A0ABT4A666_9BACT|nr:hypothetical protein [Archangium lansinium]MCY1077148.1 hypothetical protein [Archangium lansinium]